MRIVLDAMGGDLAPQAPVEGAVLYDRETDGRDEIILIGDQGQIEAALSAHGTPRNIRVLHAADVIGMHDQPATAVRRKPDSSMVRGIRLQKEGEADAFVSAGSTGAQMAASLLTLGRVKGVQRPALGAFFPHESGVTLLIDVGANADCKAEHLVQFGLMGDLYMTYIHGVTEPRIGLLNIGEEATKGNELTLEAHKLMSERLPDFVGNVEGRDILAGKIDVVVTDGFTGNVMLKFAEGIVSAFASGLKSRMKRNPLAMMGGLLARPAFRDMKRTYDYEEYGGVPLLGIDGISIICHGSSTGKALKNAIHVARKMGEKRVNDHIEEELSARGI